MGVAREQRTITHREVDVIVAVYVLMCAPAALRITSGCGS